MYIVQVPVSLSVFPSDLRPRRLDVEEEKQEQEKQQQLNYNKKNKNLMMIRGKGREKAMLISLSGRGNDCVNPFLWSFHVS